MATSPLRFAQMMTIQSRYRWIALAFGAAFLLAGASWIEWHHAGSPNSNRSKPDDPTILVLPFRGPNRQDQAELGAELARKVEVALTASHQLTGRALGLGDPSAPLSTQAPADEAVALAMGRQRRVGYIILGQFDQLGTRTEIDVRLLRVRDGNTVWFGTYWRDTDSMTAFPCELALDIAEALRLPRSAGCSTLNGPAQRSTPNDSAIDV